MTKFAKGGYIPGPADLATFPPELRQLHPDECVVRPDRPSVCLRPDHEQRHGKAKQ